jgi:cytochrome c551/c552
LSQTAREWQPEQLFYVTQKGIRMSGMPAWQYRIAEDGLWSTVAFLQRLPFLTRADYQALAARASGKACPRNEAPIEYSEDNAHELLRQYACDNCHQIPGVVGPKTYVGPALHDFARQKFIAGVLPNTHANLIRWVMDPQDVSPMTLMPDLGVPEPHARVMAQYFLGFE